MASPGLAVVTSDGGRLQVRAPVARGEAAGEPPAPGSPRAAAPAPAAAAARAEEPPPKAGHWREDKVGLLLTMQSAVSPTDPCPNIPASFLAVPRIPALARRLEKPARAGEDAGAEPEGPEAGEEALQAETVHEAPQVQPRRVPAARACWPAVAPQVAQAAWALGVQGAAREAFVGDGPSNDWTLQRRSLGSFVPIPDFTHPLSHVHAAARAGRPFAGGRAVYQAWIAWAWQGTVAKGIEALQERQAEPGGPGEAEAETSPKQVVRKTRTYLENHRDKMKYDEHRPRGLPITSGLMGSTGKEINHRVKGSEKFRSAAGSEPVPQPRADRISDDEIWEDGWHRRQAKATGQRRYRRSA